MKYINPVGLGSGWYTAERVRLPLGSVRHEVPAADRWHGTGGPQIIREPGEELVGDVEPTWQQRMQVLALRDAITRARRIRDVVTIDQHDVIEVISEHSS